MLSDMLKNHPVSRLPTITLCQNINFDNLKTHFYSLFSQEMQILVHVSKRSGSLKLYMLRRSIGQGIGPKQQF